MSELPVDAVAALQAFQAVGSWEQRARMLMQWGERLPVLAEEDKVEANLVQGCESQVWLVGRLQDGHWQFAASSEARMIRGLVALLLARVNGLSMAELQAVDLSDWFNQLGLSRQLSPSRSNGLNAVLQRMRG
ncbi:Fe-S metabolism protein SufE, partial [Pseudomonas sp. ABAC21]